MRTKLLLSFILINSCLAAVAQPRPGNWASSQSSVLYEGVFTETGRYYINNAVSNQYIVSTSFFVKIYSDKLVVTAVPFGQAVATDTEYKYTGSKDGCRIYSLPSGLYYYQVDENYDIMKVMVASSMMYAASVKDYYYYETVKGEHYQEYNKKHHTDLQSMYNQLYGPNPIGF